MNAVSVGPECLLCVLQVSASRAEIEEAEENQNQPEEGLFDMVTRAMCETVLIHSITGLTL